MPENTNRTAATLDSTSSLQNVDLTICEIENRFLWSVQPSRRQSLSEFAQAVFNTGLRSGEMLARESTRLIHLWPHKAYLLSDQATLPTPADPFAAILTDISHGYCELSITGELALLFVNSYTTANLTAPDTSNSCNLRCQFGQYSVLLWWDDSTDIRLLLDRSYAQSFRDYVEHLIRRRDEIL
jgi:sarcosine oxidase gamma subunit